MSYETIQLDMRGAVAVITLNRPETLNALTTEVGQEQKGTRVWKKNLKAVEPINRPLPSGGH